MTSQDKKDAGIPSNGSSPDAAPVQPPDAGGGGTAGGAIFDAGKGWKPATWSPPDCQVYQAIDPGSVFPEFPWVDCGNGVPGCVRWDTTPLPSDWEIASRISATGIPNDVRFSAYFSKSADELVNMVVDAAGGPRAAWKLNMNLCRAYIGRLVGNVVPIVWHRYDENLGPTRFTWGSLEDLLTGTAQTSPPFSGLSNEVQVSSSLAAMGTIAPTATSIWNYVPASDPKMTPCIGFALHDDRMACGEQRDDGLYGLHIVRADGTDSLVDSETDVAPGSLAADASTIVWQSFHPLVDGVRPIWMAFWPAPGAMVDPVQIGTTLATAPTDAGMIEGGWYVHFVDQTTIRAIRTSDSATVEVAAPPGLRFGTPVGVLAGEIWSALDLGSEGRGVIRAPLASLGAPTP